MMKSRKTIRKARLSITRSARFRLDKVRDCILNASQQLPKLLPLRDNSSNRLSDRDIHPDSSFVDDDDRLGYL